MLHPEINELKSLPFFKNISEHELVALSKLMRVSVFARREIVQDKNAKGQGLGFLLEGRLQGVDFTLDGREVGLFFVEPGDYFGELAVIDDMASAEYIIATTRSRVAMLPREPAQKIMFSSRDVAHEVALRLVKRLREASRQRTILRLPSVFQRVCAQLLGMASQGSDGKLYIPDAPTHQEIAIMIDTSRETVTRVIQQLLRENVLQRRGNELHILNEEYLRHIASKPSTGEKGSFDL